MRKSEEELRGERKKTDRGNQVLTSQSEIAKHLNNQGSACLCCGAGCGNLVIQ